MADIAKVGRPTDYTKELADLLCSRLAEGMSLRKVCEADDMPDKTTVFNWLRTKEEFLHQYDQAKEASARADSEILQEVSDEAIEESKKVGDKRANAVVSAYKLKADNLKWAMSKKMPKKYGDKLDMTTNGKDLPIAILSHVPSNNSNEEDPSSEETDQGSGRGDISIEDRLDSLVPDSSGAE